MGDIFFPRVNPDADEVADEAKYAFARVSKLIANMQYRLAELGGTGELDPDESMRLQETLVDIYWGLYRGTTSAVRDWNTDDHTWDQADNTYSDGREVVTRVRVEPQETAERHWEHNPFLLGDGSPEEYPREVVVHIAFPPRRGFPDPPQREIEI